MRARTAEETDWATIVRRYDELAVLTNGASPFVGLGRAIAIGMSEGADSGLAALAALESTGRLDGYHLLPAAQADFLRRSGRAEAAAARYREAIPLAPTAPERRFLERRLAEVGALVTSSADRVAEIAEQPGVQPVPLLGDRLGPGGELHHDRPGARVDPDELAVDAGRVVVGARTAA